MNRSEARTQFAKDRPWFEERGVIFPQAQAYLTNDIGRDYTLAMDAQPGASTDPNSSVPAMLTTYIDPDVYEIIFAPNKAAVVLGEERKGDWLMDTTMFPVVEHTGETSSYGDNNNNGRAGANTNFPNFQAYLWQTIMNYGERELARAGLARINWVSELNKAAATIMNKFSTFVYLFGVQGLQNYGMTNDPALAAPLTPATKAAGGVTWFTSGGSPNATANEVYNDIVAVFNALVVANQGNVDKDTKMKLVLSPSSAVALTFTNSFGVNVEDLLKKNFKNLTVETIPQFEQATSANPQGIAGGNLVQLIADSIEGQKVAFCAYNEKMRAHPIIRELSSFKQKITSGAWGTIIRMPVGFSQMLGV